MIDKGLVSLLTIVVSHQEAVTLRTSFHICPRHGYYETLALVGHSNAKNIP